MAKALYDISRTLSSRISTWPGTTPFSVRQTLSLSSGDSVNVGRLEMSIHTGTHVDAPYHYRAHGEKSDQLDLAVFWGRAQVVTVGKSSGALELEDLDGIDLRLAPRLLLHTSASQIPSEVFPTEIVYPSVRLVEALAASGILLLGTDAPSVDALKDRQLPIHSALYQKGISILEGLNLKGVPDGLYELSALPLKIAQGDGSPVRAVLRQIG
jgi:arylformamidase